ncbi:hypothetical protein CMV52_05145 [Klebsiella pneumoniae]|uniref:hypothetical protein n=1 Tax=Klebsiella pneumoniae TaxID=573 RepID=UPI000EB81959|nr:hypothetical protein [Klebsiella pneumoniae]QMF81496.1 hypothetical protein HVY73_05675 [Klebsiella pneumoniae]RJK60720.1 hypothetical protein CMV62_19310 [Klebsiella pneumoniae]RJK74280.1 hypothetical protein CMV52_05145 [Klebsiella pneumoniae]RJK80646.1 hypothetical protein CMV53_02620 [Klebsiella pneumoniae]RJK82362.1 hypothetical protein CMV56_01825 [Klebsiella pneumoniae]
MLDAKSIEKLAVSLSKQHDPTCWYKELRRIRKEFDEETKSLVATLAKRYWLKRVCDNYSYPIHDDVKEELRYKNYFLNDDENLLVWATVVALIDGEDADYRYQLVQNGIIKKYGESAWGRVKRGAIKIKTMLATKKDEDIPYTMRKMAERSVTARGWVQQYSGRNFPRKV